MKTRTGKLVLSSPYTSNFIYAPQSAEERAKASLSWANEDYRQRQVSNSNERAISKPEDYMPFYFRHLSATIVGAGSWKATKFTEQVLKAAAKLLTHKPVAVNHELETGNIVALNGDIKYVSAGIGDDGKEIPGGLEGPIWVDTYLHPDLCRQLTGYPVPHIQSVSVTVSYDWVPSHEFKARDGSIDEYEFEMNIGNIGADGKMICRVATRIIDFYETSLVFLGADPFAKILNEAGEAVNVERTAVVGVKQFSKDPLAYAYKRDGTIFIEEAILTDANILHLSKEKQISFSKTGNTTKQNSKVMFEKVLAKKLNKLEAEITEDLLEQYTFVTKEEVAAFKKDKDDLAAMKLAKEKAEGELVALKTASEKYAKICKAEELTELEKVVPLESLASMAKFGAAVDKLKKDDCIRMYKLAVGEDKFSQAIVDTIQNANAEVLEGFMKQYGQSVTTEFGGTCKSCKSTDIEFRSSTPEVDDKKKSENKEEYSMADSFRS